MSQQTDYSLLDFYYARYKIGGKGIEISIDISAI